MRKRQKLTDKEKLAILVEKMSVEPRNALFDKANRLISLNFVRLGLTCLPPDIGEFFKIQSLWLSRNQLISIPAEIGQLTNLRTLGLSGNQLTNIPKEIGLLTKLWELWLNDNLLTEIPIEIKRLTDLQSLGLSGNQLTAIPAEIGQLKKLQTIRLSANQLTTIPVEIGQLKKLQVIWLDENQLTAIPVEIKNLKILQELWLQHNQLTAIPMEISQLLSMQELRLQHNQLTVVPPEISQLPNLYRLEIFDNPRLRTPPPEIVVNGTENILDFLRDLLRYGAISRHEAKMIIVGEGKTGKSSLLRALRGEPFVEGLPTTHLIDIHPYFFPHPHKPDTTITLNAWDFGGQQIYHTTHQFFMTKRSLYLLVWSARGDTDQGRLDYWLRNIQVLAPDCPIILVATHVEGRPLDFNYNRFKEAYPQLVGSVGVSNKEGTGIEELKVLIAGASADLPLMEQQWPTTWVKAEQTLREHPAHHLTQQAYVAICEQAGVSPEIAKTTLGGYLHDLGKTLYFQDDDLLSNFVVLKPDWLTRAISRVLDDEIVTRDQGILAHSHFPRLWYDYERPLYPNFLKLMERFLISFQLESDTPHATHSLVPLRLPHTLPIMPDWSEVLPNQPEINMRFKLENFVPPGLMSWFIVLSHAYTQNLHWREGVRLQYEDHQAQVTLNPSQREIWLRVRGPAPVNFFNILQNTINERILERFFEGLQYKREIPCNCHLARDGSEPCPYFHDYEKLATRLKKGVLTAECGESFEPVSVPLLLEGIHYTTQDQFAAKLDTIHVAVQKVESRQEEMFVQLAQGFEHLKREFTRLWNFQMANLSAECPGLFIIMPGNRRAWNPKNLFNSEFTLYLMCQHPPKPHIVSQEKGYTIQQPYEWWVTVAPWLKRVADYLQYIPKAHGIATAYDEKIFGDIETSLKVFDAVMKERPKIETPDNMMQRLSVEHGRFDPYEVEGPALRALHTFLKEADKGGRWSGLTKTLTHDGTILWLCGEHRPLYKPF